MQFADRYTEKQCVLQHTVTEDVMIFLLKFSRGPLLALLLRNGSLPSHLSNTMSRLPVIVFHMAC